MGLYLGGASWFYNRSIGSWEWDFEWHWDPRKWVVLYFTRSIQRFRRVDGEWRGRVEPRRSGEFRLGIGPLWIDLTLLAPVPSKWNRGGE